MCMHVYFIGHLTISKQFITKQNQKHSTMTNDMNEETSNYKIVQELSMNKVSNFSK